MAPGSLSAAIFATISANPSTTTTNDPNTCTLDAVTVLPSRDGASHRRPLIGRHRLSSVGYRLSIGTCRRTMAESVAVD
jgi:hypothetical protein